MKQYELDKFNWDEGNNRELFLGLKKYNAKYINLEKLKQDENNKELIIYLRRKNLLSEKMFDVFKKENKRKLFSFLMNTLPNKKKYKLG
jgi:hypothetical protein